MKNPNNNSIFIVLLACISFSSLGQHARIKIDLRNHSLEELSTLGLAVDHGIHKQGTFFISDFSLEEQNSLASAQVPYEILIENVSLYYQQQNANKKELASKNALCNSSGDTFAPTVPSNFHLGSYAGFYTYQEMLTELDEMRQLYPNLISLKAPIGNFLTHENRPIYWVRISDNPDITENEKEVLYTAIHHAREPNAMTETIFYMWYLLENYNPNNAEIKHLIENTALYFVPCLNPDGYIHNEVNSPAGGGMHRKNKRNVGTSNPGVDLNRNYSYQWGTTGVSTNVNSDVYPGTGPFSEPETQAIKWFAENHSFNFAFNAHSYGNLILFPIGTQTNEFAVHHDYFDLFSREMVKHSNYNNTKATNLYPASGDSDDYMYEGDLQIKPRIFALTPEVGSNSDGFWPPMSKIVPNSINMLFSNLLLAHLPHDYAMVEDLGTDQIANTTGQFSHKFSRIGLDSLPIQLNFTPLLNIASGAISKTYNLGLGKDTIAIFNYVLPNTIQPGDKVKYILTRVFQHWSISDTITKTYGVSPIVLLENGDNANNWTGDWTTNEHTYYSPSSAFSDSEAGTTFSNYMSNASSTLLLNQSIDLTNATAANINFWAKWSIEADYDYAQFQVSVDNGQTWIGQCGKYTVPGNSDNGSVQPFDLPVYEGTQSTWVNEDISLSDYLGQIIRVRFIFESDGAVEDDGFYFDDFKVMANNPNSSNLAEKNSFTYKLFPNPASNAITISFSNPVEDCRILIRDQFGKLVEIHQIQTKSMLAHLAIGDLANGVYFVEVHSNGGNAEKQPLVIVR